VVDFNDLEFAETKAKLNLFQFQKEFYNEKSTFNPDESKKKIIKAFQALLDKMGVLSLNLNDPEQIEEFERNEALKNAVGTREVLPLLHKMDENNDGHIHPEEVGKVLTNGSDTQAVQQLLIATSHINGQVRRGVLHLVFCGSLTNGCQVALQVTLLGIQIGTSRFSAQSWQVLVSLCFGLIALLVRLADGISITRVAWIWLTKLKAAYHDLKGIKIHPGKECSWKIKGLQCSLIFLIIGCIVCIFQFVMALVKLGGLHCPYAMWALSVHETCWEPDSLYMAHCERILNETAAEHPLPHGFNYTSLHERWCV